VTPRRCVCGSSGAESTAIQLSLKRILDGRRRRRRRTRRLEGESTMSPSYRDRALQRQTSLRGNIYSQPRDRRLIPERNPENVQPIHLRLAAVLSRRDLRWIRDALCNSQQLKQLCGCNWQCPINIRDSNGFDAHCARGTLSSGAFRSLTRQAPLINLRQLMKIPLLINRSANADEPATPRLGDTVLS